MLILRSILYIFGQNEQNIYIWLNSTMICRKYVSYLR